MCNREKYLNIHKQRVQLLTNDQFRLSPDPINLSMINSFGSLPMLLLLFLSRSIKNVHYSANLKLSVAVKINCLCQIVCLQIGQPGNFPFAHNGGLVASD